MLKAKVYFIDDEPAICAAVRHLLETEKFEVKAYRSALAFLKAINPISLGCLITELRMPAMSGLELLEELKKRQISLPVIVLTGKGEVSMAVQAMKLGAFDFLEKPFYGDELVSAVKAALRKCEGQPDWHTKCRMALLSSREREVLDGIARGLQNKKIAHDLKISTRTVEVHRANIMAKLGTRNVADLVRLGSKANQV